MLLDSQAGMAFVAAAFFANMADELAMLNVLVYLGFIF